MILDKEGARYLREVFFPRRQTLTVIAFQAAQDRGEIPQDADTKLLMDLAYGYSLFRMITRQIEDDDTPDRIAAAIAKLARTGWSARQKAGNLAASRSIANSNRETANL
jgi:hypothetical protein